MICEKREVNGCTMESVELTASEDYKSRGCVIPTVDLDSQMWVLTWY